EAPVVARPRRIEGVAEAARLGADCVLLDDGFQHRALARDVDIVLVAAEQWRGNCRLLPRGPLREPPRALKRADLVIVTRKVAVAAEAERIAAELREYTSAAIGVVHLRSDRLIRAGGVGKGASITLEELRGRDIVAVTSLAEPEIVLEQLRSAGARVRSLVYPDHHPFGERDLREIAAHARGAPIVITSKEAVKLRHRLPPEVDILVMEQTVEMEGGGEAFERMVTAVTGPPE
ncbi:MAG TPA: tetraacyldisaccharide 4'-kinase, partial [Longimicrobiaceae bacterium]|nr:tetraacyldisaccharide 4'-kinase [Longimicrobiaceae bacterium]